MATNLDTTVEIDVSATGVNSLRAAADALAEVNQNLRQLMGTLNSVVKGFERTEKAVAQQSKSVSTASKQLTQYERIMARVAAAQAQLDAGVTSANGTPLTGAARTSKEATLQREINTLNQAAAQALKEQALQEQRLVAELRQNIAATKQSTRENYANARSLDAQRKASITTSTASGHVPYSILGGAAQQGLRNDYSEAGTNSIDRYAQARNRLAVATEEEGRAAELTSLRTAILNRNEQELARAQQMASDATNRHVGNIYRLRYALQDISAYTAIAGAALVGLSTVTIKAAMDYESLFSAIERTNTSVGDTTLAALNEELIGLTRLLPVTYEDITRIATVGSQLGIPVSQLENFTEVVAKFAATTGVSVDDAATAFGRLGQLLNEGDFAKLGDMIANVGVNSVATEDEIISVSKEIAASTASYRYGAEAAYGLSGATTALAGALASLGVPAERARGALQITFSRINSAVATGGSTLQAFATVAGTTSEAFADLWSSDSEKAFGLLLAGLQQIDQSNGNVKASLDALGISEIRANDTIARLAQNYQVLTSAQNDAANSGGFLDEAYGNVLEDLASKIQILINNFNTFAATLGASIAPAVGAIVNVLNTLFTVITNILNIPVVGTLGGIAIAVIAITGALSLATSAFTSMRAAMLAAQAIVLESTTVTNANTGAIIGNTTATGSNIATIRSAITAIFAKTGATTANTAATAANTGATAANTGANAASATAGSRVAGVFGSIGNILKSSTIPALVTMVGVGLHQWFWEVANEAMGGKVQVEEFTAAIQEAANSGKALDFTEQLGQIAVSGTGPLTAFMDDTERARLGLAALGDETTAFLYGDFWLAPLNEVFSQFDNSVQSLEDSFIAAYDAATDPAKQKAVIDTYMALRQQVADAGGSLDAFDKTFVNVANHFKSFDPAGYQAFVDALQQQDLDLVIQQMNEIVGTTYQGVNAFYSFNNSLVAVGQELYANGAAAAFNGETFQQMIQNIVESSGDAGSIANNLQGLYNSIIEGGYASRNELSLLLDTIKQFAALAGEDFVITPTTTNTYLIGQAFKQARKEAEDTAQAIGGGGGSSPSPTSVAGAAQKAAKEVRTLVDYASDLSGVLSRAFDLRFGEQQGLDTITSGWRDIQQSIRDARDRVRELKVEMRGLRADKELQKYFLSIANYYGNDVAAGQLRGDIAETNQKIRDTQKELNDAQKEGSTQLKGNSEAAIRNRAALTDLISNYQAYLVQLAESGASQKEVARASEEARREFIKQARQLGYNADDVDKLAKSFVDMRVIINQVPRNITVAAEARLGPAVRALREFQATAKKSADAAGRDYGTSFGRSAASSIGSALDRANNDLVQQAAAAARQVANAIKIQLTSLSFALKVMNAGSKGGGGSGGVVLRMLREGGYTGDVGTSTPAGVVHGKEFVFSAPAVKNIGLGNLYAMHNAAKRGYADGGYVGGGAGASVSNNALIVEPGPEFTNRMVDIARAVSRSEVKAYLAATPADVAKYVQQGNNSLNNRGVRN